MARPAVAQKNGLIDTLHLNAVDISEKKLKEKKFGIHHHHGLIHFCDGCTNPNVNFEIAQLVRVGAQKAKITSVHLYNSDIAQDSVTLLPHFYTYDSARPGTEIVTHIKPLRVANQQGWIHFDLNHSGLYMQGDFVLGIEFIPDENNQQLRYEIKLGGSAKSFERSGDGDWHIPPHHYRMYITALVDSDTTEGENNPEEAESVATRRIFSKAVQDTFSLFVHLPQHYHPKRKKTYPVLYLLDANAYFDILRDEVRSMKLDEEPIIVGIGYKDFIELDSLRCRDYTYPAATSTDTMPVSGMGDRFLSFVETELIPFVDQEYKTDVNHRTIMGHSLGGYFVLYALLDDTKNNSHYFDHYVAASPSVEYADHYLQTEFAQLAAKAPNHKIQVALSHGEYEIMPAPAVDDVSALRDTMSVVLKENTTFFLSTWPGYDHMDTAVPTFTSHCRRNYEK